MNVIKSAGYNVEPSNCQREFLYYLFDGNYPRWPIFKDPAGILNSIGIHILSKAQETVRKEVGVFLQQLRNHYRFLYTVVQYGKKNESTIITEAFIIMHNAMVKIRKNTDAEGSGKSGKFIIDYLETMVNQFPVKMVMMKAVQMLFTMET